MPAQRPAAAFAPIPPDLDLAALVEETPNFEYVVRIPCDMIEQQGVEAFEKLVLLHVIIGGKPLVIDGWHTKLDQWTFTTQWLRDNVGKKFEVARNLTKKDDMPLSINHYLNNLPMLTNQWTPNNYTEPNRQRIYLKDIDCPQLWHDKLKEELPRGVFYLSDTTGEVGGPGSADEPIINGLGTRKGRGVARAGDLMSCLPVQMRAENMMCYIGHEGTYTPAHREMCASLGQNIMVEASGLIGEDGKQTKPGSSIWFMTETKDRHLVSEYWLSTLGHDIEVEHHFAQINAWKRAPFTVYVIEQKVGDFLLIPPLAPHQVWNRGTRTMKAAWNRTTVETLELALSEALPRARMVCRDEQYKNKAIVLFSLQKYSRLLKQVDLQRYATTDPQAHMDLIHTPKIRQLQKDFKRLYVLFTQILLSEMLSSMAPAEKRMQLIPYDSNITCSYCRCNIFNRFLTCPTCIVPSEGGEEDTYDICLECYVMGRSCRCISKLKWVQQFPWRDLAEKHDLWRHQIIGFEGGLNESSPRSLDEEKKRMTTRSIAEICQEQLKIRPWRDPKNEADREAKEAKGVLEDEVNDDGSIKKKRKKHRSEKWLKEHVACHICRDREATWKLAICECGTAFCYGSLWRGFDTLPQTVMENKDWKCPRCLKICSCGTCRKDPESKSFEPNGTILGHDTKKIADPRSIESLVDFSCSNMHWVKKAGDDHPHETRRLQRKQIEAAQAKSTNPALNEHYVNDNDQTPSTESPVDGYIPIDPQLAVEDNATPNAHTIRSVGPSNVNTSLLDGGSMRDAATHALQHLNSLSRLEQDPEAFRAQAGLSYNENSSLPISQQFIAPQARMGYVNDRCNDVTSGSPDSIVYEYPDPTVHIAENPQPKFTNVLTAPVHSIAAPVVPSPVIAGKKRKRASDRPVLQSDAVPVGSANTQFQQARLTKTMAKGRKNDRHHSTQATVSNQNRITKLKIGPANLAGLNEHQQPIGLPTSSEAGLSVDNGGIIEILQSDLPSATVPERASEQPKKKRVWEEPDEDYSTRKTPVRRSLNMRNALEKRQRERPAKTYEVSGSDSDLNETANPENCRPNSTAPKERPLPAYLARRSLVDTPEVLKELADKVKQKPSRAKELSRPPSLMSETHEFPSSADEAIDEYPRRVLPRSKPRVDMAVLGSRAVDVAKKLSDSAEANRLAKLKAMEWPDGGADETESESDSSERIVQVATQKKSTAQTKTRGQKAGPQLKSANNNLGATPSGRGSMFNRPEIGKIKIASVRKASKDSIQAPESSMPNAVGRKY